jgi:hypothetical protein
MGRGRLKKYDTFSTGLLTGFFLPFGIFILIYLLRYGNVPFSNFIETLLDMKILIRLMSLCGFVNLLGFLFFYRNKMDKAARGVITATFIYAFLVLISRII